MTTPVVFSLLQVAVPWPQTPRTTAPWRWASTQQPPRHIGSCATVGLQHGVNKDTSTWRWQKTLVAWQMTSPSPLSKWISVRMRQQKLRRGSKQCTRLPPEDRPSKSWSEHDHTKSQDDGSY